jgi:hypothetical protein
MPASMRRRDSGALPVGENDRLVGIVGRIPDAVSPDLPLKPAVACLSASDEITAGGCRQPCLQSAASGRPTAAGRHISLI